MIDAAILSLLGAVILGVMGFCGAMLVLVKRNNQKSINSTFANSVITQLTNIDIRLVKMGEEMGKMRTEMGNKIGGVAADHAATKQELTDVRERVDKLEGKVEEGSA